MPGEIILDFDGATQSLAALNAAAYRLIGTASCRVDAREGGYICRLTPVIQIEPETLQTRFLDLVTDENVRESLREKTDPVRNLILSLAFGSLAASSRDSS